MAMTRQDRIPILETYIESLAAINKSWFNQNIPEKQEHQQLDTFSDLLDREYTSVKAEEVQRSNGYETSPYHKILIEPTLKTLKIVFSPSQGRYLVAMRDITAGEVVFHETPFVLAPKAGAGPTCLSCLKSLGNDWNGCEKCGAPVCNVTCNGNLHSDKECELVSLLGLKESRDISIVKLLNVCLTPLRTILISQNHPVSGEVIAALQSNSEKRKRLPIGRFIEEKVVGMLRSMITSAVDSEVIHHICGVFDTNAFEVSETDNIRGRALFPLGAIMNHDCLPNTQHWYKDGILTVKAVRDIMAGESLTNTYTSMLLGTQSRSTHLMATKLFKCECRRCLDPTELGSHISSVACRSCLANDKKGFIVPPESHTREWICQNCGNSTPSTLIDTMIRAMSSTASRVPPDDIEALDSTLSHISRLLGNSHYITLELKYGLMNALMNQSLKDMTEHDLTKAIDLANDLLKVASFIDPGLSRFRGIVLLEKLRACTELLSRTNQLLDNSASPGNNKEASLCVEDTEKYGIPPLKLLLGDSAECEIIFQYDGKLQEVNRVTNLLHSYNYQQEPCGD